MSKLIPLTQGNFAIVDNEDYEWLNQWKWCVNKYCVVRSTKRSEGHKQIKMHRFILNAQKGEQVDHKNHNIFDNRRENIRICTKSQNAQNSIHRNKVGKSKYKGVYWHKRMSKWIARIYYQKQRLWLGMFDNEIEAAKAYDSKAKELFGEFAYTNY